MQLSYIYVVSKLYDTPTTVFTGLPNYAEIADDYKRLMSFIAAEVPKLEELQDFRAYFAYILDLMRPLLEKCPSLEELKQCHKICYEHVKTEIYYYSANVQNSKVQPYKARQVDGLAALLSRQPRQFATKSAVSPIDQQFVYDSSMQPQKYDDQSDHVENFASSTQIQYARAEKPHRSLEYEQLLNAESERAIAYLELRNSDLQQKALSLRYYRDSLQTQLKIQTDKCTLLEKQLEQQAFERREEMRRTDYRISELYQYSYSKIITIRSGVCQLLTICLLIGSVGACVALAVFKK